MRGEREGEGVRGRWGRGEKGREGEEDRRREGRGGEGERVLNERTFDLKLSVEVLL